MAPTHQGREIVVDASMTSPSKRKTGFQDIKAEVTRQIQGGIWGPGTLLPTEVELAHEFNCARATVNRALRELADSGIVDRKRKGGTRVIAMPVKVAKFEIAIVRKTIEALGATYRYALVEQSVMPVDAWLRTRLSLPEQVDVMHLKCMHFADGRPFQFEERWVNLDTVPDMRDADLSKEGPNEWLLRNVPFTDAEINLSAVAADDELADSLATTRGTPLFQLERTTWLAGSPVTLVRMTFRPGHQMTTRY